ncbi:MAG: hypothetical protein M8467_14110 [Anaerolineae bacterium]|nr:hypothetical protein [Anaerolineae bacterium]
MPERPEKSSTRREYPGIYEKAVPIALGIVAAAIAILLLVILAVALGLFPGS